MLLCIKCGGRVRHDFIHFCRNCYRILAGRLQITNTDFINYINCSFGLNLTYPPYWRFRDLHKWLQTYYPSLKSLARILEAIIYLKMLLAQEDLSILDFGGSHDVL